MTWQHDQEATLAARRVFAWAEISPEVRSNGAGVYVIQPTPFGIVELAWWNDSRGYVAAAENPPAIRFELSEMPTKLRSHFIRGRLKPWRLIAETNVCDAIRLLSDEATDEDQSPPVKWMRQFGPYSPLIGEDRLARCHEIAALLSIDSGSGPLAYLEGIDGVGRKTLAAAVASHCGWRLRGEFA